MVDSENNGISDFKRSGLKHIIDAICWTIQSTTSNGELKCRRLSIDECVNSLRSLKRNTYDIEKIINLLIESPEIIDQLIDSITIELKVAIGHELKDCSYVSLILNEHLFTKDKSQISMVLRFAKKGEVRERFIGFVNGIGFKLIPLDLKEIIVTAKKGYNLENKVMALACDGGVLPAQTLLQFCESEEFDCKYFLPCFYQELGRIIFQGLNYENSCHMFFKTLFTIESYFENKDNLERLESVFMSEVPRYKRRKWDFTNPFIIFLSTYRKNFISYFHHEKNFYSDLSSINRVKMSVFIEFLESFKTIFLLELFSSIFSGQFDRHMNFVNIFELSYKREIHKFQSNIASLKGSGFLETWVKANQEKTGEKDPEKVKAKMRDDSTKKEYSNLFQKILEEIENIVKLQTKDVPRIEFCHLLNVNSYGVQLYNETHIPQLVEELPPFFVKSILVDEVNVVQNVQNNPVDLFKNKSVYDIISIFNKEECTGAFDQLYKLGEFILAMPCLPPSKDISYEETKLKEIAKFSYIPPIKPTGNPPGEVSILCVEKSMLKELLQSRNFHNKVINRYLDRKKSGRYKSKEHSSKTVKTVSSEH